MKALQRSHRAGVTVIIILAVAFGSYLAGRQDGYKQGYKKGFRMGVVEGIEKGLIRTAVPECPPVETVFIHD